MRIRLRWLHRHFLVVGLALSLAVWDTASGALVTLGEQDYSDGDFIANTLEFNSTAAGEAAPFDMFRGFDGASGGTFSASWTFDFEPGTFGAAALTLGIFDHDSAASGDQVALFTIDGLDLTADMSALFEGSGGTQLEYNVYTLNLSPLALAQLSDGSATVSLSLASPSLGGGPGTTGLELFFPNNGAGLDFSTLSLAAAAVPEPATLGLLGAGLLGFGFARRRTCGVRL